MNHCFCQTDQEMNFLLCHWRSHQCFFCGWSQTCWKDTFQLWVLLVDYYFFSANFHSSWLLGINKKLPRKVALWELWKFKNFLERIALRCCVCLSYQKVRRSMEKIFTKAVLMHDPNCSLSPRSPSKIEHKSLPQSKCRGLTGNLSIFSGGFPVSRSCSSICARTIWVLAIPWAEEEPLQVSFRKKWFFWNQTIEQIGDKSFQSFYLLFL